MYLSPLIPKSCASHNSYTVWDNLIVFGMDIYQVKKVCSMQEGQLLLCWFFTPINIQQVPFTFTKHLFLLLFLNMYTHKFKLFLNMYTHKFKVFANIVYPVQTITSELTIRWFWQKKKKKKKHAKIKSLTVHLLLFSLIILVTFHTIFAFLARLNNVHGELLYYPQRRRWRRRPHKC